MSGTLPKLTERDYGGHGYKRFAFSLVRSALRLVGERLLRRLSGVQDGEMGVAVDEDRAPLGGGGGDEDVARAMRAVDARRSSRASVANSFEPVRWSTTV